MKNFILLGAAGYISPRHMQAIKKTKNDLIAAYDPYDGAGIIDSYFPNADYFTEFERFDRHISKLKYNNVEVDYTSICSPNYLHDSHIRFGLRSNSDVICEKPLVLNPWNVESLIKAEKEYGKCIFTILQLRHHPTIKKLKQEIDNNLNDKIYDIDLTYITSRGKWYYTSWKSDFEKSGGIATNIGIHFFDMLTWIFGDVENQKVHLHTHDRASGFIRLKRANVRWFLSINEDTLPNKIKDQGKRVFRSIKIDNNELEFSDGFTDLHNISYKSIIEGKGFRVKDSLSSINIVHDIRNSTLSKIESDYHPMAKLKPSKHPFD